MWNKISVASPWKNEYSVVMGINRIVMGLEFDRDSHVEYM